MSEIGLREINGQNEKRKEKRRVSEKERKIKRNRR